MKPFKRFPFVTLLALLVGSLNHPFLGQGLSTLAASHFDQTVGDVYDGWQGTNDANGPETLTFTSGGASSNSVGYISVSENAGDGSSMYLSAPAKFRGDQHLAYNGFLTFNLKQSAAGNFSGSDNFVYLGTSNLLLSFYLRVPPATNWTAYEIPLNENASSDVISTNRTQHVGWFNVTSNRAASQDDFHAVLKSVTKLWIRGEYSFNSFDDTDLDDVELLGQPSGPAQPILAGATYAGITINGEIGASYTIEYRNALATDTNWLSLTNIILSSTPYLFIDQTSPSASSRLYRTVLNP